METRERLSTRGTNINTNDSEHRKAPVVPLQRVERPRTKDRQIRISAPQVLWNLTNAQNDSCRSEVETVDIFMPLFLSEKIPPLSPPPAAWCARVTGLFWPNDRLDVRFLRQSLASVVPFFLYKSASFRITRCTRILFRLRIEE